MRVLYLAIGDAPASRFLPQSWPDRLFDRRVGEHEVVTFGYAPGVDIQLPVDATFDAVIEALPAGFCPDVCVCVHADHLLLPAGIERAPFPTVAVTADWDFRLATARSAAAMFDLIVTLGDASAAAVHALGAAETMPFAYFGVPAQDLAAAPAAIDNARPIDILFTGTINDHTHLDRSQWLHRLSRLADRYRVVIGQPGAAPGAYCALLRRSKLVFTFHRRGELQLRFTDAVTQGAAVLDNGLETARHFVAGREYVAYDAANFEHVVAEILADEPRRLAMVTAARERTRREFESVHRLALLLDAIAEHLARGRRGPRRATSWSTGEAALRMAEQFYTSHFDTCLPPGADFLGAARSHAARAEPGPRRGNDLAVIELAQALHDQDGGPESPAAQAALANLEQVVAAWPGFAAAHFNLAWARCLGPAPAAERELLAARSALLDEGSDFDPWALLPRWHGSEYRALLRTYNDALHVAASTDDYAETRRVLAAECCIALVGAQRRQGKLVEACLSAAGAATLAPGRGDFARTAACLCDVLGLQDDAGRHYRRAVDLLPFDFDLRIDTMGFLARCGDRGAAQQLFADTVALCRACRQPDHTIELLRRRASAMTHALTSDSVRGEWLRDDFAIAALRVLYEAQGQHPDARLETRIGTLLRDLGKHDAAARWELERLGAAPAQPIVTVPARTPATNAAIRPRTSSALRT